MSDQKLYLMISEMIDKQIKEVMRNYIDLYQVVSYAETTGKITMKKLNERNEVLIEILDSGTGLGDAKCIKTGYAPGDILVVMELKGTKIILTSLYNEFFTQKDRRLIPSKNETIIKSNAGFKLLNKEGYGIECDESGNITIRGLTINHTQTKATLNYIE